jgi:hypothetical protein
MNAAPALCFVLCGVALWLAAESRRTPARDRVRIVLAGVVVAIALGKMLDLLPSLSVPVDRVLFRARAAGNRMSPNTPWASCSSPPP